MPNVGDSIRPDMDVLLSRLERKFSKDYTPRGESTEEKSNTSAFFKESTGSVDWKKQEVIGKSQTKNRLSSKAAKNKSKNK